MLLTTKPPDKSRVLQQVPKRDWPSYCADPKRVEVWRSRDYLVQVFEEQGGVIRLSACKTYLNAEGTRWEEGLTWDELQRLKRECGRGEREAVEIYPADEDVVNVANMRHLWVLPDKLPFGWGGGR